LALGVLSSTLACTDDKAAGEAESGKAAKPAEGDADGKAGDAGEVAAATTTSGTSGGAAEPAGTTSTTTGEVAPPEPPPDPLPGLMEKARDTKLSNADLTKALDEAKTAGGDVAELAKLANARGEKLVGKGEPEDAEAFFTWAKDADEKYPEPVYNLAKQSCLVGDADACKELLLEVKARGGKKLLKQVGTDPIFIIVADDSEVRKLYEK
jgi:hypothetical protein